MGHMVYLGARVTCPAVNLSLSLSCDVLGVVSTRDCECACLSLARCGTPRCAYAEFTRSCAWHRDCVDTCVCREFLCSFVYTPQETIDYWSRQERDKEEYDYRGKLIVIVFSSVIASACFAMLVYDALTRFKRAPQAELPDEGIG